MPEKKDKPWWLYLNLLSLDAPLVAVLWLYIFQTSWAIRYVPQEAYWALGLVVWSVYAFDRLLDVSLEGKLKTRHKFHRMHEWAFRVGIVLAMLAALVLLLGFLQTLLFFPYLFVGGVLVAGFFGLSMLSTQEGDGVPYLKNTVAGLCFAFGTAMTAHVYRFTYILTDLLVMKEFFVFAILCAININAIDIWEKSYVKPGEESSDNLKLVIALAVLACLSVLLAWTNAPLVMRPFYYAVLTATGLLYLLNRERERFSQSQMRVLADLSMVVPFFIFKAAMDGGL